MSTKAGQSHTVVMGLLGIMGLTTEFTAVFGIHVVAVAPVRLVAGARSRRSLQPILAFTILMGVKFAQLLGFSIASNARSAGAH